MLSRYLKRPSADKNKSNGFTIVQLDGYTIEGIVNIESITGDDNVQTSQFIGSPITVSERGSRLPYTFSIDVVITETEQGRTVEEQIEDLLKLRAKQQPLNVYWTGLTKYGVEKLNILDYSAEEYKEYAEVTLNCEEVIEYDVDINIQTPEQAFLSQYTLTGDFNPVVGFVSAIEGL